MIPLCSVSHVGGNDQHHPQEKETQKGKWLSEEGLQIAVKRREVQSKGEKERYSHLNEDFLWRIHFDIWQN